MKLWGYFIGVACVLLIEFFIVVNHYSIMENTLLFTLGGLWLWRGIASFLKIDVLYNQEYTRKRQIVMGIVDSTMGLTWLIVSFTDASRKPITIVLISVPFIIASALVHYYKTEKNR